MHADPSCYTVLRVAGHTFALDIPRSVVFAVDEEAVEALELLTNPARTECPDLGAPLTGPAADAA